MALSNLLTLALLAVHSTASSQVLIHTSADVGPSPASITIDQVAHSGNGCPRTSGAVAAIAPDSSNVSLTGYDAAFHAAIGPDAGQGDRQKNCNLMLHVATTEPGWQFTVAQSTWVGYARLDAAVKATFYATLYFSSAADKTYTSQSLITGPDFASGAYFEVPADSLTSPDTWSRCGGDDTATFGNRIALATGDGATADAAGEVRGSDVVNITVGLVWRAC